MPRNRRFATVEKSYITDIERERCKKVAAAYAELYELESILVLDVGRYGFVKLQYYTPEYGFNDVITYTDSESMFGKPVERAWNVNRTGCGLEQGIAEPGA